MLFRSVGPLQRKEDKRYDDARQEDVRDKHEIVHIAERPGGRFFRIVQMTVVVEVPVERRRVGGMVDDRM